MKTAGILVGLCMSVWLTQVVSAQQPSATPRPTPATRPPAGDLRVEPSSGPVGTVVTVTGSFDEDITGVTFKCIYRDTFLMKV